MDFGFGHLPVREAPYREASWQKVKEEIAEVAGVAESEVGERIAKRYPVDKTRFFDRLQRLFAAMDGGNAALNVPTYNGEIFMTDVACGGTRGEIARNERSALAPAAQPLQDLIDRIIYRMAGPTDEEAAGLERRLETML